MSLVVFGTTAQATPHGSRSLDAAPRARTLPHSGHHGHDNNVEWDGLRHNSRDTLYRTPGGAVTAGTSVKIRFRTFHGDVTGVHVRIWDVNEGAEQILPMTLAADDVSCYQLALAGSTCDFWEITLQRASPDNLWYRFIVTDGNDMDYYADDTPALDGGLGSPTDNVVDDSYALMFYDPAFQAPSWMHNAVIYQIFPDRFRNGSAANDPHTGDIRYDDPVLALPWGTLPEGYCRNYRDAKKNCPWRFDPPGGGKVEQPRGRDYMGGDLKGVADRLGYLRRLGVNAIYFNPLFDAASNHAYDTQDYYKIDPYFGTQKDWTNLVTAARQKGIRIILDGVFNHLSSDSPLFDRYHHYATVGACESTSSSYRSWFHFRPPRQGEPSPCAPSTPGGNDTFYDGWFGFDSIPVIAKDNPDVQSYFLTGQDSVSAHWLQGGASGWRLDVMGDPSFPDGYWETFRNVVKQLDPNAAIVGELWQKDSTLLRFLRGDRADTTMNYRLRDAVVGLLAPGPFDPKGFPDSGLPLAPSAFASRLASIQEDYPPAASSSAMDLLDSHDTERLLWTLTPGEETTASKEQNASHVAKGKRRLRLASLIQFGVPGAPTVYYGDEVGVTGDDDPDNRRTYPWPALGGSPDTHLFDHYRSLAALRASHPALTDGDLRVLLADDNAGVVAIGRRTGSEAAMIVVNESPHARRVSVPVAGYVPDGSVFDILYGVGNPSGGSVTVRGGRVSLTLRPLSGLLADTGAVDLTPPASPERLRVIGEGDGRVTLVWKRTPGASRYNVYVSPLQGGGYLKANRSPLSRTTYTDRGRRNGRRWHYVVRSLDAAGNESGDSNDVSAIPHYTITWANTEGPDSMAHSISVVDPTGPAYGQVLIDGVTNQPGPTDSLRAELGFGPARRGETRSDRAGWTWVEATFDGDVGNNDRFVATMLPESLGTLAYAYRYSTTGGRDWLYTDLEGPLPGTTAASRPNFGVLTVLSTGDLTPPAVPGGLHVASSSPLAIDLAWDPVSGDPSLYGYEILRGDSTGGPYEMLGRVTVARYTDATVSGGSTYFYVVRSVDLSFNRSANSAEVSATASPRKVSLVFDVTVPSNTDGTGRSVYIAGTLSRLDGGLPDWDPGGVVLTRVDATHWMITLGGTEGTQIEYKYTLGDWEHVEKDTLCGEIDNRQLTLTYGSDGVQKVNDTVENWRNVPPC